MLLLGILLLLIASAHAFQEIDATIEETGEVHITIYYSQTTPQVQFQLPETYHDLELAQGTDLRGNEVIFTRAAGIELSFTTSTITSKSGDIWHITIPESWWSEESTNLVITFPENAIIETIPQNASVHSFSGKLILTSANTQEAIDVRWAISPTNNTPPTIAITAIIIILGALFLFIVVKRNDAKDEKNKDIEKKQPKKEEKDELEEMKHLLTENEYTILRIMKQNKNTTQKKLLEETLLPKSTLSRTLKKLEAKQLIITARVGMNKRILYQGKPNPAKKET